MRGIGWRWVAAAGVATVLATVLATAAGWRLRDALAQDACLDAGGAWREGACRH